MSDSLPGPTDAQIVFNVNDELASSYNIIEHLSTLM